MSLVSIVAWILFAAVCVGALVVGRRTSSWGRATRATVGWTVVATVLMQFLVWIQGRPLSAVFCHLGKKIGDASVYVPPPTTACDVNRALWYVGASSVPDQSFIPAIIGIVLIVAVLAIRWAADGPDD